MNQPHIRLRGVSKEFPGVRILRDVNLDIADGELITVVGPSGCGKSTLLNGIGGFSPFTSGEATLDGVAFGKPDRHRGVVFQDSTIPEFMNVHDNVSIGRYFQHCSLWHHFIPFYRNTTRKNFKEETDQILHRVGLYERRDYYPRQLSGGQKQRVAIAQALVTKPKVLLMDEPFSALDQHTRKSLQTLLLEVSREYGITVLFITHDLNEAIYLGDRTIVLSHLNQTTPGATIVLDVKNPDFDSPDDASSAEFKTHRDAIWAAGFVKQP